MTCRFCHRRRGIQGLVTKQRSSCVYSTSWLRGPSRSRAGLTDSRAGCECLAPGQPAPHNAGSCPDVWEVIRAVKSAHATEPGLNSDDLVSLVGDNTGVPLRLVTTAVRYWAAYSGEVDAEIAAADAAEEAAEQAWLRERQLLAG